MDYKLVKKTVDLRGINIISIELKDKPKFNDLVNILKLYPWNHSLLARFLLEYLEENLALMLKLNLIASKPEKVDFYADLLNISEVDPFTLIAFIELYNLFVYESTFNSLDTSDERFQYLNPFLRRAYDPKFLDINELSLILKELEKKYDIFDTEKINYLDREQKSKILSISEKITQKKFDNNYKTVEDFANDSNFKKDYYYSTSIREIPLLQTIRTIKDEKLLEKIGIDENTIDGPNYRFGTFHFSSKRKIDLHVENSNISLEGFTKSNGKGTSEQLAWVSMTSEAIERYSASPGIPSWPDCYNEKLDLSYCTMKDLVERGKSEEFGVLNPNELNLVYPYNNEKTYWVKGADVNDTPTYVIAEAVFYPYILDSPIFSVKRTNGLAAGNTLNEAYLHSYYEILERDATSRAIESTPYEILIPCGIPEIDQMINSYKKQNLVAYLRNITMEMGIPAYQVYLATKDNINLTAYGINLDGTIALIRALAELNPFIQKCLDNNDLVKGIPKFLQDSPNFDINSVPNYSTGNVREDLKILETLFKQNNYNPIYFNLTVKEIDFPVVRIIIPGWQPYLYCYNNKRFFNALNKALKNSL